MTWKCELQSYKEVAIDERFSLHEQRQTLQTWLDNEEALLRSANEGLDGAERPHLQIVAMELQRLNARISGKQGP